MDENRLLSDAVYKVTNNDIQKYKVIEQTYELVLDTVDTDKETVGNEIAPQKNGMQAMVTATIKDRYKLLGEEELKKIPGFPESVIANHITITYAGTSDFTDWKTNYKEIFRNNKTEHGAFHSALAYAEEVEKKYPKEKGYVISTTGHSLGGAEAIRVAALKGYNAVTYGAAGPGLTEEQVKNATGLIINLYDVKDLVTTSILAHGQNNIPFYSIGIWNKDNNETLNHSLDKFHVDTRGNYTDKLGNIVVYVDKIGNIIIDQSLVAVQLSRNNCQIDFLTHDKKQTYEIKSKINQLNEQNKVLQTQLNQLKILQDLRTTFSTSGGGLSSSEQIYLDNSQASTLIKFASIQFEDCMIKMVKIYEQAMNELNENWHQAMHLIHQCAPDLSNEEIQEVMALSGYDKNNILNKYIDDFREKIIKIYQTRDDFTQLANEIDHSINELVNYDQALANQIRGALS